MSIDLDELARLDAAATPGPWAFYDRCGKGPAATDSFIGYEVEGPPQPQRGQFERGADASLVAAARNALPRLLAMARAGERLARQLKEHEWGYEHYCPECHLIQPAHEPDCELAAALAAWTAAKEGS